jgi:hypothetical protein
MYNDDNTAENMLPYLYYIVKSKKVAYT